MSPQDFNVTYSNTKTYMIYIAFLQHTDLEGKKKKRKEGQKKKKKIDLPTLPIFRSKGKQTFIFLGLIQQMLPYCFQGK